MGLPLAVTLTQAGHEVRGLDLNSQLVESLRQGRTQIEDVSPQVLGDALQQGLLISSDSSILSGCTIYLICVPTPLTPQGAPNTVHIDSAVALISHHLQRGDLVVLESTSYPGTTEELVAQRLEHQTGLIPGVEFCVAFSPERVDPGNKNFGFSNTPKVVAGLDQCCLTRAIELYETICGEVVPASGLREAELSKLLENTYRQVNIALMNEMVKFSSALDIDLYEAIRCASTKPFGFHPFFPGPGVGGHCIPIDPQYLAARVRLELGQSFRLIELAQEINDSMPAFVSQRMLEEFQGMGLDPDCCSVLILGVAYKPETSDLRGTPAKEIVRALIKAGIRISYADPFVSSWEVDGHEIESLATYDIPERINEFSASLLVTHHADVVKFARSPRNGFCLDTRGALPEVLTGGGRVERL